MTTTDPREESGRPWRTSRPRRDHRPRGRAAPSEVREVADVFVTALTALTAVMAESPEPPAGHNTLAERFGTSSLPEAAEHVVGPAAGEAPTYRR